MTERTPLAIEEIVAEEIRRRHPVESLADADRESVIGLPVPASLGDYLEPGDDRQIVMALPILQTLGLHPSNGNGNGYHENGNNGHHNQNGSGTESQGQPDEELQKLLLTEPELITIFDANDFGRLLGYEQYSQPIEPNESNDNNHTSENGTELTADVLWATAIQLKLRRKYEIQKTSSHDERKANGHAQEVDEFAHLRFSRKQKRRSR